MTDSKKVSVNVHTPLLGILTIVFVTLKLCGVIAWSWWWVLAPIWLPFAAIAAFAVVGVAVIGLVYLVAAIIDHIRSR